MSEGRPLVLDATVLSNFASIDSTDWIAGSFARPTVPLAVEHEIQAGVDAGYEFLECAAEFCDRDDVGIVRTQVSEAGLSPSLVETLDSGEAAAILVAERTAGTLVTDDGVARTVADESSISVTGSVGLLVRGVVDGELTVKRADAWLRTWIDEREYYAPVESVREALSDEEW